MKLFLNRILVVEGKEDASYLSNYIDSEIIVVNGYELSSQTINYLKDKEVILLLDPDEAGKKIRKKLNELLDNTVNIEIDINKCIRGDKNGVAECQIDEILTKLAPFCSEKPVNYNNIELIDLIELGLDDNSLRNYVCNSLKLGKCNSKQLLKRLKTNNIKLEEINEIIEKYKNGNK